MLHKTSVKPPIRRYKTSEKALKACLFALATEEHVFFEDIRTEEHVFFEDMRTEEHVFFEDIRTEEHVFLKI